MITGKYISLTIKVFIIFRFTINLQEGSYPNCDIGMHFDVRFNCGSDCNQIIRNSLSRGAWGQEERSIPYFPFAGNMPFEMIILCENGCFKVCIQIVFN